MHKLYAILLGLTAVGTVEPTVGNTPTFSNVSSVDSVRKLCPGKWLEGVSEFYSHFAGVTRDFHSYKRQQLMQEACPAETFMHNCFFHGDTERAMLLTKRNWFSRDKSCLPFWPSSFLRTISGKSLYLVGDSTMMQIWSQLFCSLYSFTVTKKRPTWIFHQGGTDDVHSRIYNSKTCPFGAINCHLTAASAWFPLENASIHFDTIHHYNFKEQLLHKLISRNRLSSQDFIIVNFGLHYNSQEMQMFDNDLRSFLLDVKQLKELYKRIPTINFIESMPQHFTGESLGNGYYSREEASLECANIVHANLTHAHKMDWRNRKADKILGKQVPRIRIADALLSQYDAHLNGNNSKLVNFTAADCTHYCAPSGVFRYIHTMIYNTILRGSTASIEGDTMHFNS